jgi:hypothetical protein
VLCTTCHDDTNGQTITPTPRDRLRAGHELIEKLWSDGQTVASSQSKNLALVAERCAHDNSFVSELLVVPAQNVTFRRAIERGGSHAYIWRTLMTPGSVSPAKACAQIYVLVT